MRSDLAAVTSAAIIATMSISTAASANDTEAEIGIGGNPHAATAIHIHSPEFPLPMTSALDAI